MDLTDNRQTGKPQQQSCECLDEKGEIESRHPMMKQESPSHDSFSSWFSLTFSWRRASKTLALKDKMIPTSHACSEA